MRLINVDTLNLEEFYGSAPSYAILSHTWGADHEELSFRDITENSIKRKSLPFKVAKCCEQAKKDGIQYAWVDTCCIDKTNSVELGEAINSMFRWYNEAAVCYSYLADVTVEDNNRFPLTQFSSCRWFQRGWTLQELLAPDILRFFDSGWHYLGTKAIRSGIIDRKFGIPRRFLQGTRLSEASIAQRMSWASNRVTKREEDIAYCLLGIFDVTMPMIYGEGADRAFTRLQQEIMKSSRDESILAWGISSPEHYQYNSNDNKALSAGVLAASPADFRGCQNIVPRMNGTRSPCTFQIEGGLVRVNLSLHEDKNGLFGLLNCGLLNPETLVAIPLSKSQSGEYYLRPQDHCAVIYDSIATKTPAQPVHILIDRHKKTQRTVSYNNDFFVEDPIEAGLELIEVEPSDRWLQDRSIITTSSDPADHAVQKLWTRFRSGGEDSSDFLVLLEYDTQGSQAQARCHMMISSRATSLQDLAQRSGSIRKEAFGRQSASDGTLNIQASVERDNMQKIFVVILAATASPPSVTINATFELEVLTFKLEVEGVIEEEDELRHETDNLNQHEWDINSSLKIAKAGLNDVEGEIERFNALKSRLLNTISKATQDTANASTRAEGIRQRRAMLSERRRSLERKLDGRHQTVLETGYGLLLYQTGGWAAETEAELAELVETNIDLVKHIDNMLRCDAFLRRFFSDKSKKGFLVYLWKKAENMYSGHGLKAHYEKPMALTVKTSMYQQVFYCDDSSEMRRENRWDVQKELVKQLANVTTQLLPAGRGVGLRFVNCEVNIFPNLAVDQVKKILDSAPLGPGGNTAIGTNLRSRILEPLVYSKVSSQRLDRPLLIIITIGSYPESRAESEFVKAIIECGRKLELAGYPRRTVIFMIYQIGTSKKTSKFVRRLKDDPDLFPMISVFSEWKEVEEETLPTYDVKTYYPVRLGEVLDGRYQVVAKLGYGVTSTVWLGRDLSNSKHVTLKIYVSGTMKNSNELAVYERINAVETDHAGKNLIRQLWDHFFLEGPHGRHMCLVHQPLGLSVDQFLCFFPGRVMNLDALKPCLRQVLGIVDFLHTEAKVIHTVCRSTLKNLLLPGDPKNFSGLEDAEIEAPSPRKKLGPERTIYTSHIVVPGNELPLLSDFGEARFSEDEHDDDIMPNIYRAPEVVLKMNWESKVDVWSIALMAWDMVCTRTLFDGRNNDGIFDDRVHLAEMVAIMGPPPTDFVKRSKVGSVLWDENSKWKELAPVPSMTFEERAADIQGPEKEAFLKLMRRALTWDPKDRPATGELIFDEWLMKGLQLPAHLSKDT
ncbi:CMGC protein kinase [Aspergillus vadensis CBS 113365]|uniref:CMGC protein kinase n=1 Tax=Aspergillus vadensis (strain CBS 113365 / IMI 142717 / IBT 24658) TaxID=1448311 RepID=A0A319BRW6_ASPVC|nr:CMGC protein kinase [Aspergillus vadensis CBS 113365]PYH75264.1 CMGC protein kinase [Aspergillus vadensis CBS 113365]